MPSSLGMSTLRVAIPIFPLVLPLDFVGPLDVFNTIVPEKAAAKGLSFAIKSTIVAQTLDPVHGAAGLKFVPDMTFDAAEEEQWDAVLVPGGSGARPWLDSNKPVREFLVKMVPKCKIVFTVCTGSWLLASTGCLSGQKATTNKAAFRECVEKTKDSGVEWIPKARWVHSGKFWTSSGVTAGLDMAAAWLRVYIAEHVLDKAEAKKLGDTLLGVLEVTAVDEDDDPWAAHYGLV